MNDIEYMTTMLDRKIYRDASGALCPEAESVARRLTLESWVPLYHELVELAASRRRTARALRAAA